MKHEKDKLRLDLSLVSGILNYAGYKGLLNYLSLETHKRIHIDEYANFNSMGDFAFIKSEKEWNFYMDKLVEMKLAIKNGEYYITRTKKKDWKQFLEQNINQSCKFNGFIHFDMTELYLLKNKKEIEDLIYLSIHEQVIKGKSLSRGFIKDLTGFSRKDQKRIEKEYEGVYLEKTEHHIPIGYGESYNQKVGEIPVFNGVFIPRHMKCIKTSKNKSNCQVIQLGNKLKIKDLKICSFEHPKVKIKKVKSNLDFLNDSSKQGEEFQDWNNLSMVLDTSGSGKSIKQRGILSTRDFRYSSWKDFKNYDYHKVYVLSEDGSLLELRNNLNN